MTLKQKPAVKGVKQYTGGAIGFSGPPGTGKSTIGKLVAQELAIPFFDLDDLIAKKAGLKTTKEAIEKKGFSFFWKVENSCLHNFFQKDGRYVLAFGGTICSPDNPYLVANQSMVRNNVFTICLLPSKDLAKSAKILWPRQHNDKRFTVENPAQLQAWIKNRMPGYIKSADRIIYTHHSPINKIVSMVMGILNQEY